MVEHRKDLRLSYEARIELAKLCRHRRLHLDRDLALKRNVAGSEDGGHRSHADHALDRVPLRDAPTDQCAMLVGYRWRVWGWAHAPTT
jgi:hypothetical protein